jgi:O-antigen ligase
MAAAFICCVLLCVALRKYRMLVNGMIVIAIVVAGAAILRPEQFSNTVAALTDTVIFKAKGPNEGLLGSRLSPWQAAIDSIRNHFWFGTGFGTSDNGQDATEELGKFSTMVATSAEHGSSYLEILTWVGMVGVLPFVVLIVILLRKVVETVVWMRRHGHAGWNVACLPGGLAVRSGLSPLRFLLEPCLYFRGLRASAGDC